MEEDFMSMPNDEAEPAVQDSGAMAQPLGAGQRDYDTRADGSPVGRGFIGAIKDTMANMITEYNVMVEIEGEQVEIPTLVPTLSKEQLEALMELEGGEVPEEIVMVALEWAAQRLDEELDVHATEDDYENIPDIRQMMNLPQEEDEVVHDEEGDYDYE